MGGGIAGLGEGGERGLSQSRAQNLIESVNAVKLTFWVAQLTFRAEKQVFQLKRFLFSVHAYF